jgi:hypothetical protein
MKASEFIFESDEDIYTETAKMVWGVGKHDTKGGKTKLKFRCTTGPRARQTGQDILQMPQAYGCCPSTTDENYPCSHSTSHRPADKKNQIYQHSQRLAKIKQSR